MTYVDLYYQNVYMSVGSKRVYIGTFANAVELQQLLRVIKYFVGYKNPKKYLSVVKKFQRETGIEIMY